LDDRDQLVGIALVGPLERADVRLVVVADEVAHRLGVSLRPGMEVRTHRVLVPAALAAANASQEHCGQDGRSDCESQALHRSRVMRSGGRKISFRPSKHASRYTRTT